MPIVPSRTRQIQTLVTRLSSSDEVQRESAAARLVLLGERAVEPLLAALAAPGAQRVHVIGVLETLRARRVLPHLIALFGDADRAVARRAIEACAAFSEPAAVEALESALASPLAALRRAAAGSLVALHGSGFVEAMDPLLDSLLDEDEDDDVRVVALQVLASLDASGLRAILDRLRRSRSTAVKRRAAELERATAMTADSARSLAIDVRRFLEGPAAGTESAMAVLVPHGSRAAELLAEALVRQPAAGDQALRIGRALRRFPVEVVDVLHRALNGTDAPLPVRILAETLAHFRSPASIPILHRALERLGRGGDPAVAEAKARIHLALATLGSRIALYDLRDMLEARPPRAALTLIQAASEIGDASLVPALAALATTEPDLYEPCASAFATIARRERLRRAHKALARVRAAHQPTLARFWDGMRRRKTTTDR
jgi:hypothetical protein